MGSLSWRYTPTTVNMNEVVKSSTTMGNKVQTYAGYKGQSMYKIVDAYLRIMEETVLRGYEFDVPGLGKFYVEKVPNKKAHITRVNKSGNVIEAGHHPFYILLTSDSENMKKSDMIIKASTRIKRQMIVADSLGVKFKQRP